jgi:glutamate--cysteine ligase
VKSTLAKQFPDVKKILLIPENHTRNLFYTESLYTVFTLLLKAGYEVRLGVVSGEYDFPKELISASGKTVTIEKLIRENNTVYVQDFLPDLILLNNDLSEGVPAILTEIKQPVIPNPELGWHRRLKSEHFAHYQTVATELANMIEIDPWLINPLFKQSTGLNFIINEGVEALEKNATALFAEIQKKYQEYNIQDEPYIIVKADAGTYGMGVMSIKHPSELLTLNRKERTRMTASKGKQAITKVILQEGVYTTEQWNAGIAEPVIYMIGEHVVGGFYRVHADRSTTDNLNAPGMFFEQLDNVEYPRFYVYSVIARLAALAAAREAVGV